MEVLETTALTRARIRSAYAVALVTDVLQLLLGPAGWTFADEILDVLAMAAISWLIGFHALLLPTFVLELLPVADLPADVERRRRSRPRASASKPLRRAPCWRPK